MLWYALGGRPDTSDSETFRQWCFLPAAPSEIFFYVFSRRLEPHFHNLEEIDKEAPSLWERVYKLITLGNDEVSEETTTVEVENAVSAVGDVLRAVVGPLRKSN